MNLTAQFLFEQLQILINIIHGSGGVVFSVMTDNLSVNQKTFRLYYDWYVSSDITPIDHPIPNSSFPSLFLVYDPIHLTINIWNNWFPSSDAAVQTKWKDLISIHQAKQVNIIKQLN